MSSYFTIITPGRTGSNHLSSMLDSHGDIFCHGEILNQDNPIFENKFLEKFRNKFPYLFCKYMLSYGKGFEASGFRILLDQHPEVIEKIVCNKSIKKIFLLRRNELKRFVSANLAETNNLWHLNNGQERKAEIKKVNFDFKEFQDSQYWLEQELKKYSAILEKTKQNYLVCFYENLNQQSSLDELLNFIGVKTKKLSSEQIKINSENLEELVENYAELKDCLKNTNISWMLEIENSKNKPDSTHHSALSASLH